MTTIDSRLRRSLDARSGDLILTLDPAFQGLPDTAHGGSVVALFDALAGLTGPRHVGGLYRRRVPLGVPLVLTRGRTEATHTFVLRDGATTLVEGRVAHASDGGRGAPAPVSAGRGGSARHRLPISRTCFACGVDNALGLRLELEFDDAEVRGVWQPREPFATADGTLTPLALTTLCDEAAFWLGALATGESGMTTDLDVTLRGAVPVGGALTVTGARAAARPRPDPRYWDTEVVVRAPDHTVVASARITFVAVRGAARRLVQGLLSLNDPEVLARVFPAYAR